MKERLLKLASSKKFQMATFYLGILFIVFSIFIASDPKPFVRLGYLGVFIFSTFGAGSIIVAALARELNIFALSLVATIGIVLVDSLQWFIGKSGAAIIEPSKKVQRVEKMIRRFGWPVIFLFALIPWPYDFVSVLAGYIGFSYKTFIIPDFIGKFLRVLAIALVILYFLPK